MCVKHDVTGSVRLHMHIIRIPFGLSVSYILTYNRVVVYSFLSNFQSFSYEYNVIMNAFMGSATGGSRGSLDPPSF